MKYNPYDCNKQQNVPELDFFNERNVAKQVKTHGVQNLHVPTPCSLFCHAWQEPYKQNNNDL